MAKLGGTGDFPRGKLNASDEGGLMVAIGARDRTVIIDFGKSIVWIGLDKQQALQFAETIRKKAESISDA
jgi:hypothetical protein